MRVVVTGGAGFIGGNLCNALAESGCVEHVIALDDLSTGAIGNVPEVTGVELVEGSILDEKLVAGVVRGVDAVVHLAARPSVPRSIADPVASHRVNTFGSLNVLEACRHAGVNHIIVASSSSVYGANPTLPKREDLATLPMSPYAATKLATESYALAWGSSFGLGVLAFRFFNVFGPLQPAGHAYAAVIPAFLDAALAGRPLPVHGDGGQTRDFTYVGTVVAVIREALERRVCYPGPVNLAFGSRVSLLELIELLESELGQKLERDHLETRRGDVRDSQADQSRLREVFPDVRPVPLEQGLRETIAWFRAEQQM